MAKLDSIDRRLRLLARLTGHLTGHTVRSVMERYGGASSGPLYAGLKARGWRHEGYGPRSRWYPPPG